MYNGIVFVLREYGVHSCTFLCHGRFPGKDDRTPFRYFLCFCLDAAQERFAVVSLGLLLHVCWRIAKTLLKGFSTCGQARGKLHGRSPAGCLFRRLAVFGESLSQDLLCLELLLALLGGGYFGQVTFGRGNLLVHLV